MYPQAPWVTVGHIGIGCLCSQPIYGAFRGVINNRTLAFTGILLLLGGALVADNLAVMSTWFFEVDPMVILLSTQGMHHLSS